MREERLVFRREVHRGYASVVGIDEERGGSSDGKIDMSVDVESEAYDMSGVYGG